MAKINFKIGRRLIGPGQPVLIVAEISGNHNQNFEKAKELAIAACEAGADAVKIQTYTPDTLTIDCKNEWFRVKVNNAWKNRTLYELYQEAYTPWEWQEELKKIVENYGKIFFSTAYDETSVDFLEKLKVLAYKIASFEITDIELLKKIAKTKKPVIISRGMASLNELKSAVSTLKKNGTKQIAILHCVSSYPAKPEEMNLLTILDIRKRFGTVAGLSDHTLTASAAAASVALGASIIEKHFTLRRADGGPDAAFSSEPEELKDLIEVVRQVEKAIGKVHYGAGKRESENIIFRRSLFIVKDIKKGDKFTRENIRSIRPGYGIAPKFLNEILGKKARNDIDRGTPFKKSFIL